VGSCLFLGSVLSATDEVSAMSFIRMKDFPQLGALIFGEGVLNDSLSIVLFKSLHDETSDANSYLSSSQSTIALDSALVEFARILWKVLFQLIFSTPTDIETANSCTQDATEETKARRIARHIAGAHNENALLLAEVHVVYVVPGTCFREWLMGTSSSGNELNSCERCGNAWNSWKHASGCAFAQSVRTESFSRRIGTYCAYLDSTAFRYYCSNKSSWHS
jgi:hypothetical protein